MARQERVSQTCQYCGDRYFINSFDRYRGQHGQRDAIEFEPAYPYPNPKSQWPKREKLAIGSTPKEAKGS